MSPQPSAVTNYDEALAFLGGREMRQMDSNLTLYAVNDSIVAKLYGTNIVTYGPDGEITLDTGGRPTAALAALMDRLTPSGVRVNFYQRRITVSASKGVAKPALY